MLAYKRDRHNQIVCYKARLVANGYNEKKETTFLYSLQADYSWSRGSHKTIEKSAWKHLVKGIIDEVFTLNNPRACSERQQKHSRSLYRIKQA